MEDFKGLCLNCMNEKGNEYSCPVCGWFEDVRTFHPGHIKPGTILNGKYLIGNALGQGGFGITYIAWDTLLGMKLAIKEYFPSELVSRNTELNAVTVYSGQREEHFLYGMQKFLEEARMLAKFDSHPGIVSVRDFFKENGTAYMVMSYIEGITLKEYLQRNRDRLSPEKATALMMPVMDALHEVHQVGILHRDISPDNIYISKQGQVKLLDFGAARNAVGDQSRSLSVVLKPGFAPEEQYRSKGIQKPWTDIYAVAATLYRMITGQIPPESLDRLHEDTLVSPSEMGIAITAHVEKALLKGLAVHSRDRFQNIRDFQEALTGKAGFDSLSLNKDMPSDKASNDVNVEKETPPQKITNTPMNKKGMLMMTSGIGILLVVLILFVVLKPFDKGFNTDSGVKDNQSGQNNNISKKNNDMLMEGEEAVDITNGDSGEDDNSGESTESTDKPENIHVKIQKSMIDAEMFVDMYGLDINGNEIWKKSWGNIQVTELDPVSNYSTYGNRVYLVIDGVLLAINRETGEDLWMLPGVGAALVPYVGESGTVYCAGYYGPFLTAVNPDGTLKWRQQTITYDDYNIYWPYNIYSINNTIHVDFFGLDQGENEPEQYYSCVAFDNETGNLKEVGFSKEEAVWNQAEASSTLESGSTLYTPQNVIDKDSETSWSEGVAGSGTGEWIMLENTEPIEIHRLHIMNGYQKFSPGGETYEELYKLFLANNRVKTILLEFSDGDSMLFELDDSILEQYVYLGKSVRTSYIKLTILDVYKGNEDNTFLTEISAF